MQESIKQLAKNFIGTFSAICVLDVIARSPSNFLNYSHLASMLSILSFVILLPTSEIKLYNKDVCEVDFESKSCDVTSQMETENETIDESIDKIPESTTPPGSPPYPIIPSPPLSSIPELNEESESTKVEALSKNDI